MGLREIRETRVLCWSLLLTGTLLLPGAYAWGYRPFVSTDAVVADPQELEVELGYFSLKHMEGKNTIIIPQVVLNYGFVRNWEVVGEFAVEKPPDASARLVDPGLFLKAVLQEGTLQNKDGVSFAVEVGPLFPSTVRKEKQFAFLAYHMLAMGFVYFNIWQIKQSRPEDFEKGLIGFARDKRALLTATSPFAFSIVPERTMLRFLKLIACDNGKIGTYAKLVDDRNEAAHPNGNIFYSTPAALDAKIGEILRVVDEIQTYSKPIIEQCYRDFLLQNHDPEEREYPDAADQIREVLIRGNYLSQKDIDICLGFDLSSLASHPQHDNMRALHEALIKTEYGSGDALDAS